MFCDVVDSTILAGRLDPEDFRDGHGAVSRHLYRGDRALRWACGAILGDGLLVYFGWPQAHEDDARRAVHAGLALVTTVQDLSSELVQDFGIHLAVRIGVHTGLVVVGGEAEEAPYSQLAVGVTPNLAAKLQALAAPETVVISATTYALVQGYFVCEPLGAQASPVPSRPVPYITCSVRAGPAGAWMSLRRRS